MATAGTCRLKTFCRSVSMRNRGTPASRPATASPLTSRHKRGDPTAQRAGARTAVSGRWESRPSETSPWPLRSNRGPGGRQHAQHEDQAEQQSDAAGQTQVTCYRVGGHRNHEEGAYRCHGASDHAAAGAAQRRGHGLGEGSSSRTLLSLTHQEVNGEVDAEAQDGDTEEGLHNRDRSEEAAEHAEGRGHGEGERQHHRCDPVPPSLDPREE